MSSDQLTPFSYAVLALVGEGGAGPHDLVQMMRRGRVYWASSESQWYAEPKRLERLGLLRSRKEPGRTRARTVYELTDAGRAALREWAATPVGFPRIQNEAIVRVLAADIVGDARALEGLRGLRADLDEIDASLDAGEALAAGLPHRAATCSSTTAWRGGSSPRTASGSTRRSTSWVARAPRDSLPPWAPRRRPARRARPTPFGCTAGGSSPGG